MWSWLGGALSRKKRGLERDPPVLEDSAAYRPSKRSRGPELQLQGSSGSAFMPFDEAILVSKVPHDTMSDVGTHVYDDATATMVESQLEEARRVSDQLRCRGAQAAMKITSSALAEAEQLRHQAERAAVERHARVEAECARIRQRAQAEASEIRREAEADATRIRREAESEVRRKMQTQRLQAPAATPAFAAAPAVGPAPSASMSAPPALAPALATSAATAVFGSPTTAPPSAISAPLAAPVPQCGNSFVFGAGGASSAAPVAPTSTLFGAGGSMPPPAAPLFGGLPPPPAIPGGGSGFALGTPPVQERPGSERRIRRARRPAKG